MRRIGVLFVLRLLLVSNAIVVTAVGGLSLAYVERPPPASSAPPCAGSSRAAY